MHDPDNIDLEEQRRLAAVIYPSLTQHGLSIEKAIDQALDVAASMIRRSFEMQRARAEEAQRLQNLTPTQRANLARSLP